MVAQVSLLLMVRWHGWLACYVHFAAGMLASTGANNHPCFCSAACSVGSFQSSLDHCSYGVKGRRVIDPPYRLASHPYLIFLQALMFPTFLRCCRDTYGKIVRFHRERVLYSFFFVAFSVSPLIGLYDNWFVCNPVTRTLSQRQALPTQCSPSRSAGLLSTHLEGQRRDASSLLNTTTLPGVGWCWARVRYCQRGVVLLPKLTWAVGRPESDSPLQHPGSKSATKAISSLGIV